MSDTESIKVRVTGGTPGTDSNDYILFDSTVMFTNGLRMHHISRAIFGVDNSQAGTRKAYWSPDRGTTWKLYDSVAVVAATASTDPGPFAYLIDPYDDWKLVWTNGGVAQGTWLTSLTLIRSDRSSGT